MKKIVLSAMVLIIMASGKLYAQTQHQNSGWFMFLNNTKFNDNGDCSSMFSSVLVMIGAM
jgi:hypothetical protein